MKEFIMKIQNLSNVLIVEINFLINILFKGTKKKFIVRLIKPFNAKFAKNLLKQAHYKKT
jgi:hypothetical protein